MKYYATVAASSSVLKSQDAVDRIERRVLDSNPIMEAFGEDVVVIVAPVTQLDGLVPGCLITLMSRDASASS